MSVLPDRHFKPITSVSDTSSSVHDELLGGGRVGY